MDIIQAMKERRSVRTFNGEPLSAETREALLEFASQAYNPFGGEFSIRLKEFDLEAGYKPSTYGMITGANDFFLIGIANNKASAMGTGFVFEQVVLKAWEMGLGTCWIAATFKGSSFDKGQTWPQGQQLRIVCPVGVPSGPSLKERITRLGLGSQKRKRFGDLFFEGYDLHSLSPESRFGQALEMMRIAPSSTNSQPWRALVINNSTVHFYYVDKSEASVLDTGIGLSHFYLTEQHSHNNGHFYTDQQPPAGFKDWNYLVSYTISEK